MRSENTVKLFRVGHVVIQEADVHYGRVNADFGQGFYLTPDREFAARWAKERIGQKTILHAYVLDLEGLEIKRFERTKEWFSYIYRNRRSYKDELDADVIVGPIANDTIYDTLGIFTSGTIVGGAGIRSFDGWTTIYSNCTQKRKGGETTALDR